MRTHGNAEFLGSHWAEGEPRLAGHAACRSFAPTKPAIRTRVPSSATPQAMMPWPRRTTGVEPACPAMSFPRFENLILIIDQAFAAKVPQSISDLGQGLIVSGPQHGQGHVHPSKG